MMASRKTGPATAPMDAEVAVGESVLSGKELRVQVSLALPADMFKQAEVIAGLRGPLEALCKALPGAVVSHSIVTPRPKMDAPAPEPLETEMALLALDDAA